MRIAIFTDSFLPQVNGVVTVTIALAERLADRGHRIYIIAPKYKDVREYIHPGVTVKRIASMPAFFYDDFRFTPLSLEILNYLKREKVEIIHFQTPITIGFEAVMIARVLKLPLVGTYHTLIADPQYMRHVKLGSRAAQRLTWAYTKLFYDRCDLVTCPTRIIRKELQEHGFTRPIRAISNGISTAEFDNRRAPAMKRKLNPRGKLLLFTGRIAYEKNLPYLLECFALVHVQSPTTKLVLVGDGPQMAEVRARIAALRLDDAVLVLGNIPHERLVTSGIFGACDVFVTASTTETQSITVLEAMANGLPCVGIKERGVAEVIKDRRTGFLVQNNDKRGFARAVLALLDDEGLRQRMGRAALVATKEHDLETVTDRWERAYAALIRRRSGQVSDRGREA